MQGLTCRIGPRGFTDSAMNDVIFANGPDLVTYDSMMIDHAQFDGIAI